MKKILLSLISVAAVAALVFGATQAFFSDTETSTGNSLVAGAIDLKIDSQAHYAGLVCIESQTEPGVYTWQYESQNVTTRPDLFGKTCDGSWSLTDLGAANKFFSLSDLKPGDAGENTISLHVNNNDAYMCAYVENVTDGENGQTEPEAEVDPTANTGELSSELYFVAWNDDGDNIWEPGNIDGPATSEQPFIFEGKASDIKNGIVWPMFTPQTSAFPGGQTKYIGLFWCYGRFGVGPSSEPAVPGQAFTCNGQPVTNASQTDSLTADIRFYVEQARNNPNFECPKPASNPRRLVLENEIINPQGPWTPIIDGTQGLLTWNGNGPTFDYTFQATGLQVSTAYKLIYSPDPWPQSLGVLNLKIANFVSDAGGVIPVTAGSINLGYDIPSVGDANYALGAKIWLVLATDHNDFQMTGWNPASYLFEGNVYINYNDTDN